MININKEKNNFYYENKKEKLRKKILEKINLIQNKINQSSSFDNKVKLTNKLIKIKNIYNFILIKPKEKNRKKEIQNIDFRISRFEKDLQFLDNNISYDYKKIVKIKLKINKLKKRKKRLDGKIFYKKKIKIQPSLIRRTFRKYSVIDNFVA
jgi:hypothetical protein|tara:strand:+ start:6892 stop:7347 length:456 start_codon:yes stop_codon:yes gene_type:complete